MGFFGGFRITSKGNIKPYGGYHASGGCCCLIPALIVIGVLVGVICLIF